MQAGLLQWANLVRRIWIATKPTCWSIGGGLRVSGGGGAFNLIHTLHFEHESMYLDGENFSQCFWIYKLGRTRGWKARSASAGTHGPVNQNTMPDSPIKELVRFIHHLSIS